MSKELDKLKSEWYQRLKDEGFDDIEQEDGNLKKWHSSWIQTKYTAESYKAKEAYYQMASTFLHEYPFESEFDKLVWEMHAEGVTAKEMLKRLRDQGFKTCLNKVCVSYRKHSKVMLTRNKPIENDCE